MWEDPVYWILDTSRQVVLTYIRNQVVQAMPSKPVNSFPPWPLLQLLPRGSCPDLPPEWTVTVSQNLLSSPRLTWSVFYRSNRNLTRTEALGSFISPDALIRKQSRTSFHPTASPHLHHCSSKIPFLRSELKYIPAIPDIPSQVTVLKIVFEASFK